MRKLDLGNNKVPSYFGLVHWDGWRGDYCGLKGMKKRPILYSLQSFQVFFFIVTDKSFGGPKVQYFKGH